MTGDNHMLLQKVHEHILISLKQKIQIQLVRSDR
jgi:hypothetical protein